MRTIVQMLAAGWLALGAAAQPARAEAEVYVVGALHDLHEREDAFGFDALRLLIEAIDPEVVVMEVRPDELAEMRATPGRPEYPALLWPMLRDGRFQAVAMEPGEPEFGEISGAAGRAFAGFRSETPADAAHLEALDAAFETLFLAHWRHPADAQDDTTATLARIHAELRDRMVRRGFPEQQARWDGIMVQRALAALEAHPRARILVLASYRNRHVIEAGLRAAAPERIADAEERLRSLR